jgi:hypothetical protein
LKHRDSLNRFIVISEEIAERHLSAAKKSATIRAIDGLIAMSRINPGSARAHACPPVGRTRPAASCFRRLAERLWKKERCARALTAAREARALPSAKVKFTAVILLLGCGLFATGCASDSDGANGGSHHRRHGGGHNRERMETVDDAPTPSPSPSRLW